MSSKKLQNGENKYPRKILQIPLKKIKFSLT